MIPEWQRMIPEWQRSQIITSLRSIRTEGLSHGAWELRRRSSPMGIRIGATGYQSQTAGEFAGYRALEDFLKALAREERRR